jgi:aspartyl-tRNA(Asn)/glutamyl-tRNA(Gln) amidotransferase subunit B
MNEQKHGVYADYEVVIGIEVHTQLKTNSKIFCACSNLKDEQTEPNSSVCPICTGHPGVLPVFNEAVIAYAVKAGIATHSDIAPVSYFDRKHYFYPDLPKGYQITQQRIPICTSGYVPIRLEDGTVKKIYLSRIHIEEDAGKNIHSTKSNESFVDLNRAGTPLLEIVSLPDMRSSFEARAYLKMLHHIVKTIDICTGNMEEGAFRADTNISVRKKGEQKLGTKCELKNINSFKFIGDAIEYEIKRQIDLLESGQVVKQETRLWDTKNKVTVAMRSKEEAADYRYFEEPDLPPIYVSNAYKVSVKASMPELPYEKFGRLCDEYGLTPYEATIFVDDPELSDYFEAAYVESARKHTTSNLLANWVLRDVVTLAKEQKCSYQELVVTPERLAAIINLLHQGKITSVIAKQLFEHVAKEDKDPESILQTMNITAPVSDDALEQIVTDIIEMHQEQKDAYKAGKTKLLGFFVGKVLEKTKGSANPATVTAIVKKILG